MTNPTHIQAVHFILYTSSQDASTRFYAHVLALQPRLHVPGMTEFELSDGAILGLMPEAGIKRLLGDALPDPASGAGIPRAELYLAVDDAQTFHQRALSAGAKELSPLQARNWGYEVAYSLDLDGHVLAFAQPSARQPIF